MKVSSVNRTLSNKCPARPAYVASPGVGDREVCSRSTVNVFFLLCFRPEAGEMARHRIVLIQLPGSTGIEREAFHVLVVIRKE